MAAAERKTGSCLCGSVSVSLDVEKNSFDACHCRMCNKWGGGPALTVDGGKNISFKGEENISVYSSSEWAERGFCKKCGTHLFYRLKSHDYCNVTLGLLDETDDFRFHSQIFVDRKPKNYEFANVTEKMTEAEVFAKYVPPS